MIEVIVISAWICCRLFVSLRVLLCRVYIMVDIIVSTLVTSSLGSEVIVSWYRVVVHLSETSVHDALGWAGAE